MQHVAFVIARTHGDLPFLGKLHGVADQIPQDLTQTRPVGNDLMRQRQGRIKYKAQPFLLRLQAGEIFQIRHKAGEIYRLVIELNFTPFHLIHVDNIVENIPKRNGRNMDSFQVFFLLSGQIRIQQDPT